MDFDKIIDRRGTYGNKWDAMERLYGVSPDDGLAMWVADTDFAVPEAVSRKMREMADHGIYGYTDVRKPYVEAIQWWMKNRHGWTVDEHAIFTTTGLVNAIGLCLDTYTMPGDGVVLFTPVYHAFAKTITHADRQVVECALVQQDGLYRMDFDAYEAQMTGNEKMVILCSPHNPGGRVWSREELEQVAAFCERHDLLLISDEIHMDLVFEGHTHLPMEVAVPGIQKRLITLVAPSKTFNFAGLHTGQVVIHDSVLQAAFRKRITTLAISPNTAGEFATIAAYSEQGVEYVDQLVPYLAENKRVFDAAINAIPGLKSTPLQATYLAWVDFSGTGMSRQEFTDRVEKAARIAANHGPTFGSGGESFLRFNLGTQHSRIQEACTRLKEAFADLQ